ncbi:MAG: T9SS type A sorting domain-containing protein, partial [Bacteroidota bacterium]
TRSTDDQHARLLHNEATTDGNWLEVATPAGLSHLFLHAGEGTLRREIDGGASYLSQAAVPLHFGWPADLTADSLVAVFTDGQRRTFTDFPVNALVEIQRDGSWLRIRHQTDLTCADEAAAPVVEKMASGQELLVQRKETRAYSRLADLTVNLRAGEPYEGVARTQDATFVDTIAQATGCPSLRFVTLRVTPEAETRSIYPNPAQGVLTLELAAAGGPLSVTVFSTTGTVRLTREYELGRGESIQQIILPKLASGTYVCRLVHGGKTTHHKFVSQ